MVLLTRHEESIKAVLCFVFDTYIYLFQFILYTSNFSTLISEFLPFAKSFPKFSGFLNLDNLCYWSFSLFSLFQKNKGLTAWILLCLPSPLSKNSKRHILRILLILPIPIYKRFQRTNRLRILLYPHSQRFKGLIAWELCLNTLEGTSFVVQVEGTSTWVWLRTREGTSLVDQF